jgi:hypothetical protein
MERFNRRIRLKLAGLRLWSHAGIELPEVRADSRKDTLAPRADVSITPVQLLVMSAILSIEEV